MCRSSVGIPDIIDTKINDLILQRGNVANTILIVLVAGDGSVQRDAWFNIKMPRIAANSCLYYIIRSKSMSTDDYQTDPRAIDSAIAAIFNFV